MSKIIGDAPCPRCREAGKDSSGNHLMLFEDGGSYCNRCGYKGSKEEEEAVEQVKAKVPTISNLPSRADPNRGISSATAEHFHVKHAFDESTGQHSKTYYPIALLNGKLIAYKERTLPKSFFVVSDIKMRGVDIQFFGQSICSKSNKKLLITGGEEDSLAAYEMLKDRYPQFEPSVVSLPNGENLNCVANNKEFLDNFEEILISTDMDDAGRKACESICKQVGEKCRVVVLEEKDASDMKTKGKEKEFINSFFKAKAYSPIEIIHPADITREVLSEIEYGLDYPWGALTKISYGLFTKQIVSIGASVAAGKSTFMQQLTSHLVYSLHQNIAQYSLEETPVQTMKKMISFVSGVRVDLPGTVAREEDIKEYIDIAEKYLLLYDAQGYLEWDSIKGSIRYMASMGTKFFVIDPLTALTASLSASRANELLNEMMGDLAQMVQSLDITVFLVSHLNNSQGKAHSEGGRVTMDQFTSSRAVVRWSHLSLGLERDQQAEGEEKDIMTVRVLKNRLAGTLGTFDLRYSHETGRLTEVDYEF